MSFFIFRGKAPHKDQSFVELLTQGLQTRVIRGPFVLLGFIGFAVLINLFKGGSGWEIFPRLFQPTGLKGIASSFDPPLLVFLMLAILLDGFIWAIYWYLRTRNPTYIKKQEAYEKWKAEKEAAKQKADEQAQRKK